MGMLSGWGRWILLVAVSIVGLSGNALAQGDQAPAVSWIYASSDGAVYGEAVSADGRYLAVVLGYGFDPGGAIVSLDPGSGLVRWQLDIEEAPSSNPVIVDGVVYAGIGSLVSGRSAVYAVDAETGQQRWRTDISNSSLPATPVDGLTFGDGTLFINRGDGVVIALDAATGSKRWEAQLTKPQRGVPAYDAEHGLVFVSTGFDGAIVHALDASTGETVWSIEYPQNPATGPTLADGMLVVPYAGGAVIAYDPLTGAERWQAEIGLRGDDDPTAPSPSLALAKDGTVYVTGIGFSGSSVEALDAASGTQRWVSEIGEFSGTAPALTGGTLVVGSDSAGLVGLDAATGAQLWAVAIPNEIDIDLDYASPPLLGAGWIFVPDNEGGFVGLACSQMATPDPAER